MTGKNNIATGLMALGGFMVMGFILIYLRDFAPNKEQWIAEYGIGKHFETRLAHVHGTLFSILNIIIGYLLIKFAIAENSKRIISWAALLGLLMPTGILLEVLLGVSPIFVLIGAISMTFAVVFFGIKLFQLKN